MIAPFPPVAVTLALIVRSSAPALPSAASVMLPPELLTIAELTVSGLAAVIMMLLAALLVVTPESVLTVVMSSPPVLSTSMLPVADIAARVAIVVSSASLAPIPVCASARRPESPAAILFVPALPSTMAAPEIRVTSASATVPSVVSKPLRVMLFIPPEVMLIAAAVLPPASILETAIAPSAVTIST